jgi:hypothetical protein
VGPPVAPAPTAEVWGSYGVFCGAGPKAQIMSITNSSLTSAGLCYGPFNTGWFTASNTGTSGFPTNCGHGRDYYGLASSSLLIPFVGVYNSNDTNGGYPDASGPLYWP